jgi:hypothetical protein
VRLLEAIRAIVDACVGQRLDYQALYPCTVVAQDGLGLLDLLPDDARIRGTGFQGIPILSGVAGMISTVPAGSRVLLGFRGGDPQRPFAAMWEPVVASNTVYNGGTEHVARTGDSAGELYVDGLAVQAGSGACLYYRSPRTTGIWMLVVNGMGPPIPVQPGTPIIIDEGCPEFHA